MLIDLSKFKRRKRDRSKWRRRFVIARRMTDGHGQKTSTLAVFRVVEIRWAPHVNAWKVRLPAARN